MYVGRSPTGVATTSCLLFRREAFALQARAQSIELLEKIDDKTRELRIRLELVLQRIEVLGADQVMGALFLAVLIARLAGVYPPTSRDLG